MKEHHKIPELKSKLLARYLASECTPEESKSVQQWLAENEENRRLMEDLKKIWELSPEFKSMDENFDVELDWAVLQSRIEDDCDQSGKIFDLRSKNRKRKNLLFLARIAAIFIIAVSIGIYANQFLTSEEVTPEPILKSISMKKGLRGSMTLSDGTKVTLNSESKIRIPSVFKPDIREVYLEGEAYFDVAKNPNKPFVIYTRGSVVEVLGTSFAIRSFPEDNEVRTVVEEGVVSFRGEGKGIDDGVILTAGKLGSFDIKEKTISTQQVNNLDLYLSWKDGYLKFYQAPMAEVKRQLERKYDITVSFENPEVSELQLTAEFKSRMLENVLETISMSLGLTYKIERDTVRFGISKSTQ